MQTDIETPLVPFDRWLLRLLIALKTDHKRLWRGPHQLVRQL